MAEDYQEGACYEWDGTDGVCMIKAQPREFSYIYCPNEHECDGFGSKVITLDEETTAHDKIFYIDRFMGFGFNDVCSWVIRKSDSSSRIILQVKNPVDVQFDAYSGQDFMLNQSIPLEF